MMYAQHYLAPCECISINMPIEFSSLEALFGYCGVYSPNQTGSVHSRGGIWCTVLKREEEIHRNIVFSMDVSMQINQHLERVQIL